MLLCLAFYLTLLASFFLPSASLINMYTCLGCAVLLCLAFYLTLLASFFLPSASLINMYTCLGCAVLLCLACFFLPSFFISLVNMYNYTVDRFTVFCGLPYMYSYVHVHVPVVLYM